MQAEFIYKLEIIDGTVVALAATRTLEAGPIHCLFTFSDAADAVLRFTRSTPAKIMICSKLKGISWLRATREVAGSDENFVRSRELLIYWNENSFVESDHCPVHNPN